MALNKMALNKMTQLPRAMLIDTLAVSTMELADFTHEAFDQLGFTHPRLPRD